MLKLARLNDGPEIFHSIQGEGISIGKPSVFIRASLCNLHCRWCDTDYTWNWEGTPWEHENDSSDDYQKFSKEEYIVALPISEIVELLAPLPCRNVILTGGEPLLQDAAWCQLMEQLLDRDSSYRFEVETNGTLEPSTAFDSLAHQYNVSPKLANSGNPEKLRYNNAALTFFSQSEKTWFKFVIDRDTDLTEVESLIKSHNIRNDRVILMPEGKDAATLNEKKHWLTEICIKENYRFSDRLHIQLWGSKRGV